jgi:hypothetical protein
MALEESSCQLLVRPTENNGLSSTKHYGTEYGTHGKSKLVKMAEDLNLSDAYLKETTIKEIEIS